MSDLNNKNEEIEMYDEEVNTSTGSKIINIIASPSKALNAIKQKPNLLIPILLVIFVPVLYYVGFWNSIEIQMIRTIEAQFELQGTEVTQEILDLSLGLAKWGTPLSVAVFSIIGGFFSATYYFICGKIAKSEMSFKQTASLVFHVMIISLFSWVLMMILTLVGIDFKMEIPFTSLASLFPNSMESTFMFGLALPIEVFSVWGSVITYYGLRIIGDMSKKAAIISVVLAFATGIAISGGSFLLTSFMSTFT